MAIDPKDCRHEEFAARVAVNRFEDTGRFLADITVRCRNCDEPFRFLGVPPGHAWDQPACSIDGTELHVPIEPEIEKRLFAGAAYQMPPAPEPRH